MSVCWPNGKWDFPSAAWLGFTHFPIFPFPNFVVSLYLPVLATSQGSTIVSPVINLNVSERDMNMGSFFVIRLWADTAKERQTDF